MAIQRASAPSDAIVLTPGPVHVCCSARVCGDDKAALAAAAGVAVHAILPESGEAPTAGLEVWTWQIDLEQAGAWSMAL